MEIKILNSEKKLCHCCMEEHYVKTIEVDENIKFKGIDVEYKAVYYYCDKADELFADEAMLSLNDISMKNAYRIKQGLLTSDAIIAIRNLYEITQKDLCILLGWGEKTVTRYESHQVQDKAHDIILRKLEKDPEWYLYLLNESKSSFTEKSFKKYLSIATNLFEREQNLYLQKAIEARYAKLYENPIFNNKVSYSLNKAIDAVNRTIQI